MTATTLASAAGAATAPANAPIGATGSVAALSGSTMEVQNPSSGQTTVNWTSTTNFSKSVTETVSSLTPGTCVTVTGTSSKSSKTTIAARSISVVAASTTGSCTGQFRPGGGAGGANGPGGGGFRFGGRGGGTTGGTRPTFNPGSGRRFPNLGSIAIATGKVTAVSGTTLSVSGYDLSPGNFVRPGTSAKSTTPKTKKPTTPKTENLKITTTSATTVAATQSAAATDLAVGDCVSAFGPAATTGAVTATTVRITSTGGQTCTAGFGAGRGGFFRGGGGGGGVGGSPGGGSA